MSSSPVEESEPEEEEQEVEMEISEGEEEIVYEEVSEEEEEEEEEGGEEEEEVAEEEEEEKGNPKQKPSVVESITHLQSLHGALSDFLSHYNALQQTLDSINSAIDARSSGGNVKAVGIKPKTDGTQANELESICRINGAKALRRYISTHLSEVDRLRREVPQALKLASEPTKLVLEAMGRFYLQGSKAYERGDQHAVDARRSGILLLEFYVLAGCPVAQQPNSSALVRKNARDAAVSWRSRLISEGGIETASAADALGLVLLVASFGVPPEFKPKDMHSLLRLSNLKKKGDVLRRSPILVQKMPDIINGLLAKEMHVEAVELVCAFGLEEKFPPQSLLSSFVKKACDVGVGERSQGQSSLRSLKEAYEKELAALKLVVKCVGDHKLDASKLASLQIDQKISKCEKEILKAERKLQDVNLKRKFGDVEVLKNLDHQAKQLRPSAEASGSPLVQSIRQTQEQGIAAISDSIYAYKGYVANNSSEASHGLRDRDSVRVLERNVHGQAVGWHGNAFYPNSGGQSLLGGPHSTGREFAGYSAPTGQSIPAAGQNAYQPSVYGQDAYQTSASGQNAYYPRAAGQDAYEPPAYGKNAYETPASGQHDYYSLASGQNAHRPPASVQTYYQHPASGQNIYEPHASSLASGARNLYQFADGVSPSYSTKSNAVPAANPSHQTSHAS